MTVASSTFTRIQDVPWLVYRLRVVTSDTPGTGDQVQFNWPFQEAALTFPGPAGPIAPGFEGDTDMRYGGMLFADIGDPNQGINLVLKSTVNGAGTPADPFVVVGEFDIKPTADTTGQMILDYYMVWFKQAELGTQTFNVGT